MPSITCECGERVDLNEVTNSWYDAGVLFDNEEAIYAAECANCHRVHELHQFKSKK